MSDLLVVDFDYFFVNKLEGGHSSDDVLLYDWGHNESELYRTVLWPIRGASFLDNGFPLPGVTIPKGWWDRFTIAPNAVCTVSDSNVYSGMVNNYAAFDHVWLFDAHHDLYAINTPEQLARWEASGKMSCEDWMFAHYIRGSNLHWRWPKWHRLGAELRDTIPAFVGCDAQEDDTLPLGPEIRFDAVSICRSGCWVPPWCDEEFVRFYQSCPAAKIVEIEDVRPREYEAGLDAHRAAWRALEAGG